ncbi:hypothetical protein [Brachyspira pilosicoli]|uniref:hypothetical protein n=1 Tax=Brachyspira pilosicoli TaxID=52584 RepID=UPI003006344F
MKKLFLVLSVMILSLNLVYAQDEAQQTTEQQTETQQQNTETAASENTNTVEGIVPFSPNFADLRNVDDATLDKEYNILQTNLNTIKDDYLFRVLYKANKILENYTNVNFTDTNEMFYNAINYYDLVARPISTDNNVDLGLNEISKAIELYNNIKPTYEILGKTNELAKTDYELNLYAGILNLFKGSPSYYSMSRYYFNKALENEINNQNSTSNLIMLNTYLAGVNYLLANNANTGDIRKVYYLNEMFNNLWDLTTLKNEDENIKSAKYKLLITKYHKILYTTSDRFKAIYSKYYDELGFVYANTEDEVLSREVAPVYKEGEANEANTANTTTTENTETAQ